MPSRLSIIICTCNRAASLRGTLEALGGLKVPPDVEAEVVVVDNGSTDDTPGVVASASLEPMPVRYLLEPRRGQVRARNCGLANTVGDVVLFTDDDIRPPPEWIERMCRPILTGDVDAVAGGVIPAAHLPMAGAGQLHRNYLACTDGINARAPERMVGANMGFARRVLERVPAFDPELGPGALGFGDDTLFSRQLLAAGYRIGSAFDCPVEHHFDPGRLTRPAFLETARKMGRSEAYVAHHWEHRQFPPQRWRNRLRKRLELWQARLTSAPRWLDPIPPEAELQVLVGIAYRAQARREVLRPRNYDRLGLMKLAQKDDVHDCRSGHVMPTMVRRTTSLMS